MSVRDLIWTGKKFDTVDSDTIDGVDSDRIKSRGVKDPLLGSKTPMNIGLSMYQCYDTKTAPEPYGNVLSLYGENMTNQDNGGHGGCGELFIGWSSQSTATEKYHSGLWVRSKRDLTTSLWSDWARVYTTAYKPTAADIGAIPATASCNKRWHWEGKAGQPVWLWGGNEMNDMYVYNPANFNVNHAKAADKATSADRAITADRATNANFATTANTANNAKALDGVSLQQLREEIKMASGGDFMGKKCKPVHLGSSIDLSGSDTFTGEIIRFEQKGLLVISEIYCSGHCPYKNCESKIIIDDEVFYSTKDEGTPQLFKKFLKRYAGRTTVVNDEEIHIPENMNLIIPIEKNLIVSLEDIRGFDKYSQYNGFSFTMEGIFYYD